jgi:hypothetical protein
MSQRINPDLDAAFMGAGNADTTPNGQTRKRRKRRSPGGLDRDRTRRIAFRVLALLADLPAPDREKVLKCALRIHRA